MYLLLPKNLYYPITITKLLKQPNDTVERLAPLFSYLYATKVTEGDEYGEEHEVEKKLVTNYQSNVEGTLKKWKVAIGTVIDAPGY
jgi:RNA polymerase II subunit A-like phosphatase